MPSLLDLTLATICQNINEYDAIRSLPDLLRQKLLNYLFRFAKPEAVFTLQLGNCSAILDEELKDIVALKNLTTLDLSHCDKLVGLSLSWICKLPNLQTLKLSHCSRMFMGFYFLQSITSLRTLDVAFCEVPDPMVEFLSNIPNLTNLNLMCNRITDEGAIYLKKCTQLKHLTLAMNPHITDNTLEYLSGLKGLVALNLDFCKLLTGPAIEKLSKQLPSLEKLDIVGCDRATNDSNEIQMKLTLFYYYYS